MKIAIIGAMESEITFLLSKLNNYKTTNYYKYTFYEGDFNNKKIIVTSCGIGKVASAMLVAALVNYYKVIDLIINIGISGGILGKVDIGDIVVAKDLKYADVDVTIFNYEYGTIPNGPNSFKTKIDLIESLKLKDSYKIGTILSGDQFYHKEEEVNYLINTYFKNDNVLCIDMESAALAHASWFYNINYLAIRAISDVIGSKFQDEQYNSNLDLACIKSNMFLLDILENI